jgi:hypothetical protein
VPECISRIHHGHALGQKQRCQQIPLLLGAQGLNIGIVGGTLDSAIPASIVVVAVAIFFAIGFVVFFVVTDQILQREAVMRGDKINAGVRTPAAVRVEIAGAGDAIGQIPTRPPSPFQ